jgi:predicted phosphoribosyltransferase
MSVSTLTPETEQVVLALPKALVQRAERIARKVKRPLEAVLTEWLDRATAELPVEALDDEELLAACASQMTLQEQAELSRLLEDNREERLDEVGRALLDERMRDHDDRLLRKSQALREAVSRGICKPLTEG